MEICSDWSTNDSVRSATELEICDWSDEASLAQLPVTIRKRRCSTRCDEEEANTWDEVEWSTPCSSVEDFFTQSQYDRLQKSLPLSNSDRDADLLSALYVVSSVNSSPKPSKAD